MAEAEEGLDPLSDPLYQYRHELGRFTSKVCFVLPVRVDRVQELYDAEPMLPTVGSDWIDDDAASVVTDVDSAVVELQPVEAGRGASGIAIAYEVANVVATIGGVWAVVVPTVAVVKRIWQRLRRTKRGMISISSGAAALLALEQAATRNDSHNVRLANFGAVDPNTESSYSGYDVYWTIVEVPERNHLEFYMISDQGDVTHVGTIQRPIDPMSR